VFTPGGLAALIEEPDPAGGKVVHRSHKFHSARRRAGLAFGRFEHVPNGPAHVGLERRAEQRRRGKRWIDCVQGRGDVLEPQRDPACSVPWIAEPSTFPATRTTNSSPNPESNVHVEEFYLQSGALL
jgi:hypothetical protein